MFVLYAILMGIVLGLLFAADAVWNEARRLGVGARRVLALESAAALPVAVGLALILAWDGRWWTYLLWGLAVYLPLTVLSQYVTTYRWRLARTRAIDAPLRDLRRELAGTQQLFDQLTWEIRRLEAETTSRSSPVIELSRWREKDRNPPSSPMQARLEAAKARHGKLEERLRELQQKVEALQRRRDRLLNDRLQVR